MIKAVNPTLAKATISKLVKAVVKNDPTEDKVLRSFIKSPIGRNVKTSKTGH